MEQVETVVRKQRQRNNTREKTGSSTSTHKVFDSPKRQVRSHVLLVSGTPRVPRQDLGSLWVFPCSTWFFYGGNHDELLLSRGGRTFYRRTYFLKQDFIRLYTVSKLRSDHTYVQLLYPESPVPLSRSYMGLGWGGRVVCPYCLNSKLNLIYTH